MTLGFEQFDLRSVTAFAAATDDAWKINPPL
jgi:hypothetical protein